MCIPANDVYTDWIVRITKATPAEEGDGGDEGDGGEDEKDPYTLRIFAEDLGSISSSDFDFNDVVFDVWLDQTTKPGKTVAHIRLLAAGGIYPVWIGQMGDEYEIHKLLGVSESYGTYQMINTGNGTLEKDPVEYPVELDRVIYSEKDVPIYVQQPQHKGEFWVLQAPYGQTPQKIGVPVFTPWSLEYVNLNESYPSFNSWVTNLFPVDWTNVNREEKNLYKGLPKYWK